MSAIKPEHVYTVIVHAVVLLLARPKDKSCCVILLLLIDFQPSELDSPHGTCMLGGCSNPLLV